MYARVIMFTTRKNYIPSSLEVLQCNERNRVNPSFLAITRLVQNKRIRKAFISGPITRRVEISVTNLSGKSCTKVVKAGELYISAAVDYFSCVRLIPGAYLV